MWPHYMRTCADGGCKEGQGQYPQSDTPVHRTENFFLRKNVLTEKDAFNLDDCVSHG